MENKTFTFEDIMLLDDLSLRRVMGRVESEHLENAFIGADAGIVAKACNNMSLFARDGLSRMLQTSGAEVSQSSIESSREKIANIITWFAGEGRILSPDSWRVPAKNGVIRQIEEAIQTGRLDLYNWYCQRNALVGFEEVVKSAFDSFKGREKELSAITSLKIKGEILYSSELLYSLNSLEHLVIDYEEHLCSEKIPQAMFSKSIGECKNLKSLVFSTPYSELPEWIFALISLTDLCLKVTSLGERATIILSEKLGNLINLKTFSSWLPVDNIPDSIVNLEQLESLEISSCNITSLPENIGKLTSLKRLKISHAPITHLPESIGNLTNLLKLNVSYTPITHLPESMKKLISLKRLDISNTHMQEIPLFFENISGLKIFMYELNAEVPPALIQNKNITIKREHKIEMLPSHELNFDEFIHAYYMVIQGICYVNHLERRIGLLALEDFFKDLYEKNDFWGIGMMLVIDGTEPKNIRHILSCKIEHENGFLKKKLREVQMEGILGIQRGETPEKLILHLNNLVDIDVNQVTPLCNDYLKGNLNAFEDLEDIYHELPKEREEVAFIKRAVKMSELARRKGVLALESEWNREGYIKGDIFEYGIRFVIDDFFWAYSIESELNAMIEREHNPWKKKMGQVKKTAVLGIQSGDNPRMLEEKLLCYFDDHVYKIIKEDRSREE